MISAARGAGIEKHAQRGGVLRLDSLANPFAPAPHARRAQAGKTSLNPVTERLQAILAARLARRHQISPACILLAPEISTLIDSLDISARHEDAQFRDHRDAAGLTDWEPRLNAKTSVYVMSPDDPLGSALRLQQAVRLARSSSLLVIDERHAGYTHRDHLPLFKEFEHVVLLRSLEYWAGLVEAPLAYAIIHPPLLQTLSIQLQERELDPMSLTSAIQSIEHERYLDAAARQVANERVNLIRSLRKLNMVRPFPSAANFVCARLERGERHDLREYLEERGIVVHYPGQPGMEQMIRVSAVSAAATKSLCDALIAWAREI